jgi:8-oxo-dGTP pyrophosphatase MutT (NUDIX family)
MFAFPRNQVAPVSAVEVRLEPGPHPFEVEHAAAIEASWQREVAANPALFDGRVVLLSHIAYDRGRLAGRCHAVRYATLLHWRHSRPPGAEHAFAHAALVSGDGALVAIRMGAHTANAGKVYFAAGSFEPVDFRDGLVDIDANMAREVLEETGLDIAASPVDETYHLYSQNATTVIFRRYHLAESADAIAARISAFVAAEAEPEIEGPVIIRGPDDLPDGLMPHMRAIVDWHFGQ